jgi:hypothetical protein
MTVLRRTPKATQLLQVEGNLPWMMKMRIASVG